MSARFAHAPSGNVLSPAFALLSAPAHSNAAEAVLLADLAVVDLVAVDSVPSEAKPAGTCFLNVLTYC